MSSHHDHEHHHEHSHDHKHSHEHPHDHNHEHGHGGQTHTHGEGKAQSIEESLALLGYMLEHNRHHAEDLHELLHGLEAAGSKEAAALATEALHFYEHGNDKLAEALTRLKGE